MAKRSNNNSAGRRPHGEKPYDPNNSFVKKMATRMGDLIPHQTWISKWFNSPGINGDSFAECEQLDDQDAEDQTMIQPPTKRPRIRMDVTHPPGTFAIQPRGRSERQNQLDRNQEEGDDNVEGYHEPSSSIAGPSSSRSFVASTPAVRVNSKPLNSLNPPISSKPIMIPHQKNNGAANGTDEHSESGDSTSGCSSLIPQTSRQDSSEKPNYINSTFARKGLLDNKSNSFTNHLQSPRSLFLESITRDSMSTRRPSFNVSIMNNNNDSNASNNVDTSSILSSPFYRGNIAFGGANAVERSRRNLAAAPGVSQFQLKTPRRSSVQVKPSNTSTIPDSSGMSQTAKRILEALEHFSSPISDAKKIPVKTPGSFAKKRAREEAFDMGPTSRVGLRHLTRELAVPTVPEMLKLKRRQRLQDTTLAARRIISANSGPPPSSSVSQLSTENQEYRLRNENESQKFFGKLRTKAKKKTDIEQPAEMVNLPSITLPITSLPSFDIPLPKPSTNMSSISTTSTIFNDSSSPSKIRKTEQMNSSGGSIPSKRNSFKFSSPIRLENDVEKNLKSINHFTFSKPIIAESQSNSLKTNLNFICNSNQPATNFMWSGSSTAPRPKTTEAKQKESPKKDVELKSGSCMEILGDNVDKSEESYWECNECIIKNNSNEEVCVACKVSKKKASMKKTPSALGNLLQPSGNENPQFGSEFKMSNDKWECQCCLVRNPVAETKCLSCMAPKQDKKPEKSAETVTKSVQEETIFGKGKFSDSDLDKFKPAKDSWECSGCMLRNPGKVIACPCCNQTKPGLVKTSPIKTKELEEKIEIPKLKNNQGFGGFKIEKPANSWECPSCMVSNNSAASQCVCCSTPCPSSSKSSTIATSQQPIPKIPESGFSGFGDKFKKPTGSWTCDSCMLSNNGEVTECVACGVLKPGATSITKKTTSDSTPKFSFGIPSTSSTPGFNIPTNSVAKMTETSKTEASTNGFTFGIPPTSSQTNQQFTFGIPSANKPQESSGFAFAPPKNVEGLKKEEKSTASPAQTGGFSFNIPTEVKKIDVSEETKEKGSVPTMASIPSPFGSIPKVSSISTEATKPVTTFTMPEKVENTQITSTAQSSTTTPSFTSSNPALFTFSAPKSSGTEKTSNVLSFGQLPAPMMNQTSSGTTNTLAIPTKPAEQVQKSSTTFGTVPTTNIPSMFGEKPTSVNKPANLQFVSTPRMQSPAENKSLGFGIDKSIPKIPAFGTIETKTSGFGNLSGEKTIFNAPTSIFGAPATTTAATTSIFGASTATTSAATAATPASIFGAPSTTTTATPASIFGAPATTTAATATPATPAVSFEWSAGTTIFGSNNGNSAFGATPANTGTNIFGNSSVAKPVAATQASTPSLFTFGASSSQTSSSASSAGVFGFGNGSNTNTPAPTPTNQETPQGFGFGTNPTPTPPFARFGDFGAPQQTVNPTQPTPFSFIPPKQNSAPAFGQSVAVPHIFESAQPSSASSFSSLTPSSSGGYNFGVSSNASNTSAPPSASSASGGFPFSAPPATPRQTGFNFNAPNPASAIEFNFTGGSAPTIFAATPQTAGGRKIKKAVRRIPPRT